MDKVALVWVDFKPVAYKCWESVIGKGHIATTNSERVEFIKAMELYAEKLKTWFPNAIFCVAADSKSWRHRYLRSWWESRELVYPYEGVSKSEGKSGLYYFMEGQIHYLSASPQGSIYSNKPKKADQPKDLDFTRGAETIASAEDEALLAEARRTLRRLYKAGRAERKWDYTTTKDQFNDLVSYYALYWARDVLGGTLHMAKNMEADDVIAQGMRELWDRDWIDAENQVAIASSDYDLKQLCGENAFFLYTTKDEWHVLTDEEAQHISWEHVLCGDTSDAYSCVLKKNGVRMTKKPARKLIEDLLWSEDSAEEILKDIEPEFFERNMRLAVIPQPDHVELLQKAVMEPVDVEFDMESKFKDLADYSELDVARALAKKLEREWLQE